MTAVKAGLLVVVLVGLFAVPTTAQAGERYYFGSPTNNLYWPYCGNPCYIEAMDLGEFLNESSARTVNTRTVCAATLDTAVVCSSDVAYKALCGCQIRRAYSRSTYWNPVPQGRARGAW